MAKLLITYKKSTIGYSENQKRTVRSLGLRKLHQQVVQPDNAAVRGMVFTVRHLVVVEEVADGYELPTRTPHLRPTVIGQAERPAVAATPTTRSAEAAPAPTLAIESTAEYEGVAEHQGFAPAALIQPQAERSVEYEGAASDTSVASLGDAADNAPAAQTSGEDDLELIEGIGPKIGEVLRAAGVTSFAKLATMSKAEIEAILDLHPTLRNADPTTWPEQAELAAAGNWDEFKQLTDRLKSGRAI